jgi:hypothetical protein
MRRVSRLVAGLAVGAAAIAAGDASPAAADGGFRAAGAILLGANEVAPGDPDGIGVAGVTINVRRERICYFVAVRKIAPATMAHIHRGVAGENGPVVVDFDPPDDGFSAACVDDVGAELAAEIAGDPSGFYVNVHNEDFPGGAVRGQLR